MNSLEGKLDKDASKSAALTSANVWSKCLRKPGNWFVTIYEVGCVLLREIGSYNSFFVAESAPGATLEALAGQFTGIPSNT